MKLLPLYIFLIIYVVKYRESFIFILQLINNKYSESLDFWVLCTIIGIIQNQVINGSQVMGTISCYKLFVYLPRTVWIKEAGVLFGMSIVIDEFEAEWDGCWEEQQAPDCRKPESIL
jgi:spore maturation protein SpmB